jgi:hypothetical protein
MTIFRDNDGNHYDIPDEELARFQVKGELPEGAQLSGAEAAGPAYNYPAPAYNYAHPAYNWQQPAAAYNYQPHAAYNYAQPQGGGAAYNYPHAAYNYAAYNYEPRQ